MTQIFDALTKGIRDLFQLQVLWIMIWPLLLSMLLWAILGIALWGTIAELIQMLLLKAGAAEFVNGIEPVWIANILQLILHFIIFIPMVLMTAFFITAIFAMPALIRLVADRHYPTLVRKNGGSIFGNISNALIALLIYILVFLLVIPLWFVGLWVLVPFIAASYLNQRLFRYDAISEHASKEEMPMLFKKFSVKWWLLGMATGLVQFVPFLNLIAPVLTALVFIHFGLARIQEQRTVLNATPIL